MSCGKHPHPPSMRLLVDKQAASRISGTCAKRLWERPLSCRAKKTLGPAGKTPPWRRNKSAAILRDLRKLYDKYGYNPSLYGHFGQGCIHCRVDFDLYTEPGVKNLPLVHGGSDRS